MKIQLTLGWSFNLKTLTYSIILNFLLTYNVYNIHHICNTIQNTCNSKVIQTFI